MKDKMAHHVDAQILMLTATITQLILEEALFQMHVVKDEVAIVSANIDR